MQKVVVTGGAGFIGSNMVDRLIAEGKEVIVLDNFSTGKRENCNPKATVYDVDLSTDHLQPYLEGVDVVFHFAALARVQPSIEDPLTFNNPPFK